jgi:hypothetical protein
MWWSLIRIILGIEHYFGFSKTQPVNRCAAESLAEGGGRLRGSAVCARPHFAASGALARRARSAERKRRGGSFRRPRCAPGRLRAIPAFWCFSERRAGARQMRSAVLDPRNTGLVISFIPLTRVKARRDGRRASEAIGSSLESRSRPRVKALPDYDYSSLADGPRVSIWHRTRVECHQVAL